MIAYLLHLHPGYKHASHFFGVTNIDLDTRLEQHRAGLISILTKYAVEHGSRLIVVKTWEVNSIADIKAFKRQKHNSRYCPICTKKPRYDEKGRYKGCPENWSEEWAEAWFEEHLG